MCDLAGHDLDEREVVSGGVQRREVVQHAARLEVRLVGLLARLLLGRARPRPQHQDQPAHARRSLYHLLEQDPKSK